MKKFLYLASGAALALASCSDDLGLKTDNTVDLEGKTVITAELNVGEDDETRTSLNSSYQYLWNQGDALGLFGGLEEYNVQNADFYYAGTTPAQSGTFAGQVSLLRNARYFAYYPWSVDTKINYKNDNAPTSTSTYASVNLSIRATQNFNINNLDAWSDSKALGSFANNTAPSVGVGYAGSNNQINFSMKPIASYLVFPITGSSSVPVQSIELTINNGTTYYNLPLTGEVNLTNLQQSNTPNVMWGTIDEDGNVSTEGQTTTTAAQAQSITLLCSGSGVNLSEYTHPVNFWFVIPPGIPLENSTVTLKINGGDDNENGAVVTKTLGNQYNMTAPNNVQWVWAGKELPFTFTPGSKNTYEIATAAQFIEYAYLVTKGVAAAVEGWESLNGSTELSDLPNMLTGKDYNGVPTLSAASSYSIKNAVIGSVPLDLSQSVIADFCGVNLSNPTANDLETYYNNVYINGYLVNGLAPIGTWPFTLGGTKAAPATITNLVSNGPVFASGKNTYVTNIQYLTLQSCTANKLNTGANDWNYFLLGDASSADNYQFTGVTVGAGCNVGGTTAGNVAIYPTVLNADINSWKVTNQTPFPYYAQTLTMSAATVSGAGIPSNMAFDFRTSGMGVSNFKNINIAQDIYASGLIVSDASAAESLINKVTCPTNGNYAVIEYNGNTPVTSYWTGTAFKAPTSTGTVQVAGGNYDVAETLAGLVENGGTGEINMSVNFNLMGTYKNSNGVTAHKNWYISNNGNSPTVTVKTNANNSSANTISNVWLDDTMTGTKAIMTVLGYQSVVPSPSHLYIEDVTTNVSTDGKVVATVSVQPAGISNVSVNNATVNIKNNVSLGVSGQTWAGYGGIGGLYQYLTQTTLGYIGNCEFLNGSVTSAYQDVAGIVAGVLDFSLGTPSQLNIPYVGPTNAFGVVNVTVGYQTGASSFFKVIKDNAKTTDDWMTWNFKPSNTVLEESNQMQPGYTLYVTDVNGQYLKRAAAIYSYNEGTATSSLGFPIDVPWSSVNPIVQAPNNDKYTQY